MIRVGDRVYPWMKMNMHGKVIQIKETPTHGWMLGGVMQKKFSVVVQHDNGEVVEYQMQDLVKDN